MPTWLSRTLFFGLAAVFVLMPVHAFISTWGGTAIGPLWLWKSWKELLLSGLFLVVLGWLVQDPSRLSDLFKKPYVGILVAYVLLTLVLAAVFFRENGAGATAAGLAMNLRYLLGAVLAYTLFRYGGPGSEWLKWSIKFLVAVGVVVAGLGVVQVLLLPSNFLVAFGYNDATTIAPYTLIDNNPHLLRAFATLRGPNDFGAFLILPLVAVLAYIKRWPLWLNTVSLFVMMWALILSGSRSAWIGLVVAVITYLALDVGKRLPRRSIVGGAIVLAVAAMIGLYGAITIPAVRTAVFHSSAGDPTLTEGSTDNHLAATLGGIQRVVDDPLGCGPGCAGPASYYGTAPKISENYFVQIAEETGVIGLALFVALLWLVAKRLVSLASEQILARILLVILVGYIVIGLLLHMWADDPLSITWWMLLGAVLGYNDGTSWKKSKNSSRSRTSSSS